MAEDLNSLRTLLMLYETRSVTASAERLHVSQPTVSYTLGRLRRRFGDELFRRAGNTLVPTSRAALLYDALREPLSRVDRVTSQAAGSFDPAALRGEFVLALSSMGEISWLPTIVEAVERQAPGVRLRVTPLDVGSVEEGLVRGVVDLAITMTVLRTERLWREPFYDVEYVAVTGARHPLAPGEEGLRSRRFVEVAGRGGHVFLREALHEHGLADRVFLVVDGYAAVPHALESTDLVGLLPRYFAENFKRRYDLAIHALPWKVPSPPTAAYTRMESTLSRGQAWLRGVAVEALRTSLPRYAPLG